MKRNNLLFVLKKTISDRIKHVVETEREERMEELLEAFHETGAKQVAIALPSGDPVATMTLAQPKPKLVVRESEVVEWLIAAGRADLVTKQVIPEHVEYQASKDFLAAVGATETETGEWVTPQGEIIPGVKTTRPGPKSFTVRYGEGGQDKILNAWRDGKLDQLITPDTLLGITGGQEQVSFDD